MKTLKITIATGLALAALTVVTLAMTWWQPPPARAKEIPDGPNAPTAPLILPTPFLNHDDVADAYLAVQHPRTPTRDELAAAQCDQPLEHRRSERRTHA